MKKIYFGNIRFLHQKKLKLQFFRFRFFRTKNRLLVISDPRSGRFKKWDTKPIKKFGISYTVNMYCTLYSIHILLDIYVVNLFNCLNIYFRGIYIFHGKLHVPSHSTFSCHNEYSDKATINNVLPLKCGHVVATTVAIAQLCV